VDSILTDYNDLSFDRVLHIPHEAVEVSMFDEPCVFLRVPLARRSNLQALIPDYPPLSSYARWRRDAGVTEERRAAADPANALLTEYERILLELPQPRRHRSEDGTRQRGWYNTSNDVDPVKLVRALGFAVFLRSTAEFTEALEAALEFQLNDDTLDVRSQKQSPSRSTLMRSKGRLVAVSMLLTRRRVHAWLATKQIRSIDINTDASPTSGMELQGTVFDFILMNGEKVQLTPPGASLTYGHYDACNKTVALLHGLWCMVGPSHDDLREICLLVRGICTDHGIEIRTLDMPDFTEAYVKWMDGATLDEVKSLVRWDRRLLPNALRISGWNHTFGNIMRKSAESCSSWPAILTGWREQVDFWKNLSWRKHVARAAAARGIDSSPLQHFTASFTKWRYETVAAVSKDLVRVRPFAEGVVCMDLFAHAQDREKVKSAVDRCKDAKLQRFTEVSHRLLWKPLEASRRWGMTCDCPHHVQQRIDHAKKHIRCSRNGHKLGTAWDFIQTLATDLEEGVARLTPGDCEDDVDVCTFVHDMALQAATSLRLRFKYLGVVPWRFAGAGRPEVAQECIDQMKARPLSDHDPVAQDIWRQLQSDLERCAGGGGVSPALQRMLTWMGDITLDESAGEGFHRSISHENCRCHNATTVHLKRSVCYKNMLADIRQFMRVYGERGKSVIAFEWKHYTRLLRISGKRWRGVKMPASEFMSILYRENERANEDWSRIIQALPNVRPVVPEKATDRETLEREWLVATLRANQYYTLNRSVEEPTPDGGTQEVATEEVFQVLSLQHAKNRPHLVHTVQSADDPVLISGVSLGVVICRHWVAPNIDLPNGARLVFPEGPVEWVAPARIANFSFWFSTLTLWKRCCARSDAPGCLMLTEAEDALPRYPLTDERCPVLTIIKAMQAKGWLPIQGHVLHKDLSVTYDGREAVRMRWYYTLLLFALRSSLPLASGEIPSQEPGSFYRLLLKGIATQAGLGDKHYMAILNKNRASRGKEPLPLDMEELCGPIPLPPPPTEQGDVIMSLSPDRPKRPKVTRGGHGPIGSGAAGSSDPPPVGTRSLPLPGPGEPPRCPGRGNESPPVVADPPPVAPLPPPAPPPAEDEICGVPPSPPDAFPRAPREYGGWYDGLDGSRVKFRKYPVPREDKTYINFHITCTHKACKTAKTKGTTAKEPTKQMYVDLLCFLHAWRAHHPPNMPGTASGARWNPQDDHVRAYMEANRAALEQLADDIMADS